jgi:hypothetical protein
MASPSPSPEKLCSRNPMTPATPYSIRPIEIILLTQRYVHVCNTDLSNTDINELLHKSGALPNATVISRKYITFQGYPALLETLTWIPTLPSGRVPFDVTYLLIAVKDKNRIYKVTAFVRTGRIHSRDHSRIQLFLESFELTNAAGSVIQEPR